MAGLYYGGRWVLDHAVPPGTPPAVAVLGTTIVCAIGLIVGIGGAITHPKP